MSSGRWGALVGTLDALLLTAGIGFLAKFVRYGLPPLFGTFQQTYEVAPVTLVLLFSLLMLVYAGMQFPSGALAVRFRRYPLMVGSLALALASVSLAALLLDGPVLLSAGLVALVGLGGQGFRPVRESHLVDLNPAAAVRGSLGLVRTIMMGVRPSPLVSSACSRRRPRMASHSCSSRSSLASAQSRWPRLHCRYQG